MSIVIENNYCSPKFIDLKRSLFWQTYTSYKRAIGFSVCLFFCLSSSVLAQNSIQSTKNQNVLSAGTGINSGPSDQNASILALTNNTGNEGKIYSEGEKFFTKDSFASSGNDKTPSHTADVVACNNVTSGGYVTTSDGQTVQVFCATSYNPNAFLNSTSASGGSQTLYYQWQSSTDNYTWTDISGATSGTYNPPTVSILTYYRRLARRYECSTWLSSNTLTIAVNMLPAVSLAQTDPTCGGTNGTITATGSGGIIGTGSITFQKWNSISGSTVANLTSNSNYPNSPSSTTTLISMETSTDMDDNFGGRLIGYITPTITGTYYFWVSSDDNSELWLSTDESSSNKSKIAYHTTYTGVREWNKVSTQKSAAINLVAGEIYYIEAIYKEGGGGDNLAVGWAKPGDATTSPSEVIPIDAIRPYTSSSLTTATYQYKLDNGSYQTSNLFTGLAAGTYTVTIKDVYGCTATSTVTLSSPTPTVTAQSNEPLCVGETLNLTGSASPTPSTYNWTGPGSFTSTSQNPSRTNATTAMSGIYTLAATFSGCTATVTATTSVTVNTVPSAPGAVGATRCGTGTLTLSASGCSGTYRWYSASTGGTLLGSASTYTTPGISSTTNYYVECSLSSCSSIRTLVIATVNANPSPTATGDTECEGSTVILGSTGGTSYSWAGPNSFTSTAQNPTIPNGTTGMSGVYTVTVTNAAACTATATASVLVKPIPSAPTGADVARCNTGTVTLTATGCSGGTYTWYANATTSTSLATGTSYTTPSISATTTYYVSCTLNGCVSTGRGSMDAIVTAPPSAPTTISSSRCGTGTVSLSASGCSGTYAWYTAATGGSSIASGSTYTTPSLSTTTSYYVECNFGCASSRSIATATVNAIPTATATGDTECEGSTVALASSGGVTYSWAGPNSFTSTSQNPTIPNGTTGMSGVYTVTVTNAAGCTATATASVLVKPIPGAPGGSDVARCGTGTVALTATGCSGTYTWYFNTTTSTSLATGATYTTPSISATTTYYVSCTLNGCVSNSRGAINAIVTTPPSAPSVVNGSRCGTGTVALSASGCSGTYAWYTAATGGSSIGSGSSFTTPSISSTTNYYVECTFVCVSTRAIATATINALPTISTTGDSECEGSTIVLGASGGVSYSWAGPNAFTSNVQNPGIPNGTTGMSGVYTVTVTNAAGCTATATASVLVKPIPAAPSGTEVSRCGTGTVTLTATGCSGGTYTWYANATTSTSLGTGTSYTTASISSTTTYHVSCTLNGCVSATRGTIDAVIKPIPAAPTTSPVSRCGTGTVTISADNCAGTVNWYAAASGGSSLGTGNYTTPSLTAPSTTTYYAACTVNGCVSTSRTGLTVTVLSPPTASASNTGTHCMGTTFKLIGGGNGESFSWSGPNGFSSSEQSPLVSGATSAMAGVYTLTVTASNGCTTTATTNMVINSSCGSICTTPISVQPTNPTACSGTDGYIFVTEYSAGPYYENSMDGVNWYNSEKTYSSLGVGYYTVFIRDKTSKIVCRTISVTLTSITSSYYTGETVTSATGCAVANGKIVLQGVLGTDDVSWISSTSRTYVKVSTLSPSNTISNLTPGTYYVIVTRGGNPLCYSERRVTVGNSGAACPTGLCTIAKNTNLFPGGDFGSGSSVTGPSLAPGESQYSYAPMNCDSPNDGNYTITNTTDCNGSTSGGKIFTTWDILTQDHTTGDANGYMMIVNASYNPDIVIERTVTNLCPNTRYEYSLWIYNLCPAADAAGCTIKPNLTFLVDGVGKYTTGDITGTSWQQVGFTFTTGNSTSSTFSIRNNATGGQGNDWAIDDIAIIQCLPAISQSADMTKCIGTTGQTISATVTDGSTQYTYYKWQESSDGGTTWTDLTSGTSTTFTSGAYTVSYTLPTITAAMNGRKYKIVVGTSLTNLANSDCSYDGTETTLTVPVITITPSANQTICVGSSATITASASGGTSPYTYSWNNGLGSGASKTTSPTSTTVYTVTVTDATGCTATATTQVTVNSLPAAPTAVNGNRCGTGTVSLGTTGCGGTVSWYASSTATSSLATGVNYTTPGISTTTTYYVNCTVNGCVSATRTAVVATVNTIPTASATGDVECAGSTINLSATGGSTYSWTGPSGFSSTAQNPTRASATTAMGGVYTVTVTSAEGCTATATASVTVNPAPTPSISGNTTICVDQSTTLTASGGETYVWSTGETSTSISVSPTTTTIYTVTAYASNTSYTNLVKDQSIFNAANFSYINASSSYAGPSSLFDGVDNTGGDTFHATRITNGQTWGIGYTLGGDYLITALSLDGRNDCCTDRAKGGVMQIWKSGSMVYQSSVVNGTGSGVIGASPAPNVIGDEIRYVFLSGANTISGETTFNFSELIIGGAKVCSANTQVTVTVNPKPTATASSNTPVCVGKTLNLTSSGGTSYSWTGPNSYTSSSQNPGISNVTAAAVGVYTVTVTNANGCTATATTSVVINALPTPTASSNTPVCVGQTLNLSSSGGTSYSWSGPNSFSSSSQNPGISNVPSVAGGVYTVTVTNANGCTATATTTVVINALPTPTANSNTPVCVGQTLNLTSSGGTSYSWAGPNAYTSSSQNPNITNVTTAAAGVYTVTVTNANGCTATATTTVVINALPTPTASSNTPVCVGKTLNLTSSGGTSYSWTGPNSYTSTSQNPSITNVTAAAAGVYTVTVTNANGCTATATTSVVINALPTPTASSNTPVCVGKTLNLTSSGGTSYSWTGPNSYTSGSQNPSISNVTVAVAGVYTVTVTNANGCTATATTTVVINALPTPTASSNTPVCVGQTLNLTSSGGTSYSWTGPNSFSSSSQNPSISNVQSVAGGVYTVTVTNANGCTATATTTVVINALPTPTANSNTPVCVGQTLNLTSSGGTSYSWTGPNSYTSSSQNPGISNVTSAASGIYTVTVTNANGCTATATTSIVINALPTPTANSSTPVCVGKTLNLTSSGGTSYSWIGPNSYSSSSQNPSITNVTTAAAGIYTVTVTNANGCTATATTSVVVNALPTPTAGSNTPVCVGQTLNLSSSGGTSYSWSGPNSYTSSSQNPSISNVTSAAAGVYTVTVTNANGCTATATTTVVINALPTPTAGSNTPVCVGQTLNLSSSGGTSYSWSGPNSYTSSSQNPGITNVTAAAAGVYTVTVTNANGCSATATTLVVINALPTPTASSNTPVCVGQTLNLSSSGGTSYSWSGPNSYTSSSQNPSISNVTSAAAGVYTVTVTNANGCSATATTTVVINALPTPTASSNTPVCVGQTLNLTSSGGTSYAWSGPNSYTSSSQNPSISNVTAAAAGVYTVTVTNANGCTATATTSVVINALPSPTASSNTPVCAGKTLNLTSSGGTGYSWAGPNSFSSSSQNPSINNVQSVAGGVYTVTVTNSNGCTATATTSVVINTLPTPTASSNTPVCVGQTLNLTSSGGTSYSWSGPNSFSSSIQNPGISNVPSVAGGIYTVTVTNANGCTATATTTVVINALPTPTAGSNTPVCAGQTLNLSSSGGTSYAWSGPNSYISGIQNSSITNVTAAAAGVYTVTVTNSNGCTATATTSVVINALPSPTASSNTPVCAGQTLNLSSSGGTSYAWSGPNSYISGIQNSSITNVTAAAAGVYTVTVTNSNGCTATATTSVVINALPSPTASSNTPVCVGQTLNLSSSGGTSYSWTGPNSYTSSNQNPGISNVTSAASGIYTVTVTNANGCTATATTSVVINALPTPTSSSNTPVCVGKTLNLTSSGGTSYSWTGPNSYTSSSQNPGITNVTAAAAGVYTVTVTNANGCTATATTSVVINALPTPTAGSNTPVCVGQTLNLTSSGGTSYSWSGPNSYTSSSQNPGISNVTSAAAGVYTVTVTNANGCSATATTSVVINALPTPTASSNTPVCVGKTLNLTSSGGTSYSWTGPNSYTSSSQNPGITNVTAAAAGVYTVTVTNANGCTATATTSVVINALPTPTTSSNTPVCVGQTLNLTSSGGTSYSWSGPNSYTSSSQNPGISNVTTAAAGVYTVTVTNANGCTATATTSVVVNALPTPTAGSNTPVCVGQTLNLTSSGGTSYSWSGPNSYTSSSQNPGISNVTSAASGIYTVTVTNANGCTATATTSVVINALPTPTASSNTPVCVGQTLNLTSSGGTSYSWTGPNSYTSSSQNPGITNVTTAAAGVYTVTVTNANGCTATATTSVVINTLPTPTASSNTPVCVGKTLNLTSSGGTSYSWTGPNSYTSSSQNPGISNVTAAAAGVYTVTVTNANGCTATATTSVVINALPIPTAGSNTPVCVGQTLNLTSSGGTSYSWTGPNNYTSSSQNPGISNVTAAAAGVYTVTVTNANGCTATATTSVVINALPIPTAGSNTPVCVGQTLNLTSSGGTSYSWTGPNSYTSSSQNPSISNITAAAAGVYTVTVTNANGCTATATTSVVVNALPTPTAGSNTPVCVGQTLNLTSSGGTSYSWTGPNSYTSSSQNPSISNVTAAAAGVYTVTVTNSNGCTATATTSVVVNALPTPTASTNTPVCVGQTLNLTSSGGTSYSWTGPNSYTSSSQNPGISNVTAAAVGVYTVTVTNANGCTATATTSVVINALPNPTASSNTPVCVGQTLNLTSSGGTSYSWSGPNSYTSSIQNPGITNVTAAAAGVYTVTVTNANGCTATATTSVVVNALPTPTAGSNTPVCVGQTLNLTSSGGTSYAWAGPNSFSSSSQNPGISNVPSVAGGVYTVTVTNANGCTATATTTVVINALPSPTANSNTPVCAGKTLNLTSSGGTSYSWAGPNSYASSSQNPSITNVTAAAAGVYTVTVTNANGCTATATTSVVVNALPIPTASSNTPVCVGQTLNLTSSGGTSYSWTGPNSYTSSNQNPGISNVTSTASGIYTVTVTNANGCTATATTSVVINALPTPTANSNTPVCVGQTLNLTSSGGTSYAWAGPNSYTSSSQNPSISNVTAAAAGVYTVTVTNSNGCTATATTSVVINALPTPTAGSNTPVCVGQTLNLTSSGGTSYAWTGPNSYTSSSQNPGISNVTAAAVGVYTVTVTNANGCTATATTSVVINALPTPTASSNTPVCVGQTLNLSSSGGTSYSWSGPNSYTSSSQNPGISNVTAAAAGVYTVTVTNANGCTATATTSVVINALPTPTASSNTPVCVGQTLNLTSSGGTSYSWAGPNSYTSSSQNPGISNVTAAAAGIYTITVTNANGCTATATTSVVINGLPTPTAGSNTPVCVGQTLNLTSSGGTSYSWTGPNSYTSSSQNPSISNVTAAAGVYTVTVTNANGCTVTATTSVVINALPTPTAGSNTPVCVGQTLNLTSSGGTSYSWTGPNSYTSSSQNPGISNVTAAAAGVYTVTVTNANGCTATATTSVVINALPTPTASSNTPVCVGQTLNLTSSGGTSYAWSGPNSYTSSSQNPSISNVTTAAAGVYTVTVTNSNGCTATATTAVVINALPIPTANSNTPVCAGQTLNLTSSGGASYSWSGPNSYSSGSQNPSISNVSSMASGIYTVTVTNSLSCSATATINVVIYDLPTPPTVTGASRCGAGSVTLTANGCVSGTIQWYDAQTGGNLVGTGITFATNTITQSTFYFASCFTNNCSSPSRTAGLARINSAPNAELIPVNSTCIANNPQDNGKLLLNRYRNDDQYSFNIGTSYNSAIASAFITIPSGGLVPATNLPNPTGISQAYTVRIKNVDGCTIDRTVLLTKQCEGCPQNYCPPATAIKTK